MASISSHQSSSDVDSDTSTNPTADLVSPLRAYMGMTELPRGSHGNLPDKVYIEDIKELEHGFVPPRLLTPTQLLEQIGPAHFDEDPLWFLYDIRKFPCIRRLTAVSLVSGLSCAGFSYYLFRRGNIPTALRFGSISAATCGSLSLLSCLYTQFRSYNAILTIRSQHRGLSSLGLPENIQQGHDLQKYLASHPEIQTQHVEMMKYNEQIAHKKRLEEQEINGKIAFQQLLSEYNIKG